MSLTRKRRIAVGTTVLVMTGAGAAFAYWTVSGSGTGTAQTGTNSSITAVQTTTVAGMAPGDTPQLLAGTFNNPNPGPVFVSSVTASIESVTPGAGAPAGLTCDASDYTLANPVMGVNTQVPAGDGQGGWGGATIQFNNKPDVNQDACKGATVNVAYAIA